MPRGDDPDLNGMPAAPPAPGPARKTKRARALYALLTQADPALAQMLAKHPKQAHMAEVALRTWQSRLFDPARHETRMELTVALVLDAEARADHLCHYRDWRERSSWWTTPLAPTLANWYRLGRDDSGIDASRLCGDLEAASERPAFRLSLQNAPSATLAEAACANHHPDVAASALPQALVASEAAARSAASVAVVSGAESSQLPALQERVAKAGCALPDELRQADEDDTLFDARRAWVAHEGADAVADQVRQRLGLADDAAWLQRYLASVQGARFATPGLTGAVSAGTRTSVNRLRAALGLVLDADPRKL